MAASIQHIRQIKTITDLRNFAGVSKAVGKSVILTGYAASGDSSTRSYIIHSGAPPSPLVDDGGYCVVHTSGAYYFICEHSGAIEAEFYGPKFVQNINIQGAGTATIGIGSNQLGGLGLSNSRIGSVFIAWQPGVSGGFAIGIITAITAGVATYTGTFPTAAITTGNFIIGPANKIALQNAVDFAVYKAGQSKTGRGLRFMEGGFSIDDMLSIGYGVNNTISARIRGDNANYGANSPASFSGPAFYSVFIDRPAINIQGCSKSSVGGFSLNGPNYAWITINQLGFPAGPSNAALDDRQFTTWCDVSLGSGIRQYASPVTGITVDAYSGPSTTPHFPNVTYPTFFPGTAQYNKLVSTLLVFDDIIFGGYFIGCSIHPSNISAQGDMISFNDCVWFNNALCVSASDLQGRQLGFQNGQAQIFHTFLANGVTGFKQGRVNGTINNFEWNAGFQIFDCPIGEWAGSVAVIGSYCEAMSRIGNWGTDNVVTCGSLSFKGTDLAFQSQCDARGWENSLISCGDFTPFSFSDGILQFEIVQMIDARPQNVLIDGATITNIGLPGSPNPYEMLASNYWTGGLAFNAARADGQNFRPRKFSVIPVIYYDVDTGISASKMLEETAFCDRGHPIYYAAKSVSPKNSPDKRFPSPIAPLTIAKTDGRITSISRSGTTLTVTMDASYTTADFAVRGGSNGDIICTSDDLCLYEIHSVTAGVITAKQKTGYSIKSAVYASLVAFSATVGNITFHNTRVYCTSQYYVGDITAGNAFIDNVSTLAIDSSGIGVSDILNGDFICDDNQANSEGGPYGIFPRGTYVIDHATPGTVAGTVKLHMSSVAKANTSALRVPLCLWIRPAPANV